MAKGIVADSIQNARTLLLAHSAAVAANDIIVSNGNVLVAVNTALISANNAYVYMGKVIFPKVAGTAFDPGDKCYWDAAAGNITKVTSGNTLCGFCTEAAGAPATSIVMMLMANHFLALPASAISISDSGNFTSSANVEAALAEIYQGLISTHGFVPISLMLLREVATMAVGNSAANGGLLASDTTPILQPINGATDGCQEVVWAAANVDPVIFQVPLPPDIDITADVTLHTRIRSGGTTNAVGFTVDTWWGEGDTKITDTSETNQTNTWADKKTTIAAADLHAGGTVTVSLTPVTHATDNMQLSSVWLEYKTKILTS